jgi:hypothetical protein|tara:strand:+ start:764 stop:1201 length:438 start_codon:yes stop_codon:yes gene_type:complete
MNIKIENEKKETETTSMIVSINGVSGFWKHHKHENCWIYNGRMPISNCWVFINENSVQILNVAVHNPENRKCGFGSQMISDIRCAFPNSHIWVDTWNCSRPFWKRMMQRAVIDFIANDYSWPCTNTTCKICHKDRPDHTRRTIFD